MSIFDFFGKKDKQPVDKNVEKESKELLDDLINEARSGIQYTYWLPSLSALSSMVALKKKDAAFIDHFSRYTAEQISVVKKRAPVRDGYDRLEDWCIALKLSGHILKLIPSPDEDTLVAYIQTYVAIREPNMTYADLPYNTLLDHAENLIREKGLTPAIVAALPSLHRVKEYYAVAEVVKVNERINFLLQGQSDLTFDVHDAWGKQLDVFFTNLDHEQRESWQALFRYCSDQGDKNAPSQQWSKKVPALLDIIGRDHFARALEQWLEHIKGMIREIHKAGFEYDFLRESNHNLLRALIWCGGFVNDMPLNRALDDYASWAYKKKPGVGPISARTGTACMYAFSLLPFKEGVSKLTKFRVKIKNNTILKGIDKIIQEVSKKSGISREEMEELGVPDFGLDQQGVLRVPFDEYIAVYTIRRINDTVLEWEKDSKLQKSVPAAVKESHGAGLKALKALVKEIESLLPLYRDKLEQGYLIQKSWPYEQWKANYLHHPFMSVLAKKLIWHFTEGDTKMQGIWLYDQLVSVSGHPLPAFTDDATVQLWHPIGFPVEAIVAWRNFMQQHEITQPFKQAYREVYLLTDAELTTETYSNRFAAHVLRQHQFVALCKQRGWQYNLMGQWDSHNTPTVYVPAWNMMAQYYVDAGWNSTANDVGIYSYIQTDQVRFYREGKQLKMHEVPAMVFTEIMRDVDLFVGVTSIGNDPTWQNGAGDAGMNTYWENYSFGDLTESANIRAEVLKGLVPRLKIKEKCSFDGKFLVVNGALRTYKIHMGSGNILMKPNDQYLCIVPAREKDNVSTDRLFLPFEGDNMLSIIISKALLLAEDDKIKDETITRQIRIAG